jgi:NAD dependent epimerase/dehydratase family enzyme
MKKKIIVFGATGYIARNLIGILNNDYEIVAVSRSLEKIEKVFSDKVSGFEWDYSDVSSLIPVINNSYAVINLTGENISGKRWTKKQKSRILFSRTEPARIITEAII